MTEVHGGALEAAILGGHRVIRDLNLAAIYGVKAGRLNRQTLRGSIPGNFMFRLTGEEAERLRSQIAILKTGRGSHAKFLPSAFTEHGAIQDFDEKVGTHGLIHLRPQRTLSVQDRRLRF